MQLDVLLRTYFLLMRADPGELWLLLPNVIPDKRAVLAAALTSLVSVQDAPGSVDEALRLSRAGQSVLMRQAQRCAIVRDLVRLAGVIEAEWARYSQWT